MGSARFSPTDWSKFTASSTAGRSTSAIFTGHRLHPDMDPAAISVRESRDSAANPASTAIMVGLDVTGSMGMLADVIVRDGMRVLFEEIYDRKPVSDPHILFAGIGDVACDQAPLQVSQFEADICLAEQLTKLWLEHGGGGNSSESYDALWWFAACKTATDCWERRGRKGYLFTVGDEMAPYGLRESEIGKFLAGKDWPSSIGDMTAADLLAAAESKWNVFHVVVEEGDFARRQPDAVVADWRRLLGQRVLRLADHTALAEVIVSAIQVAEGSSPDAVVSSWTSKETALAVSRAVEGMAGLTPSSKGSPGSLAVPF